MENQVGREEAPIEESKVQIYDKLRKSCLVESGQCCVLHFPLTFASTASWYTKVYYIKTIDLNFQC